MHLKRKLALAASLALLLLLARTVFAADDLENVLHQLDVAAANFHSTSADFEFDVITTDPIYEKDVLKGVVYYERKGTAFQMAAHIREENNKPVPKVYTFSGGVFKLYDKPIDQVTTYAQAGKYESYAMLGFGASGKDLAAKWDIKYQGSEILDGVKTDKLELVAKDPVVRKNFPKITIWVDPERGVNLKQDFDEGPGAHRVCLYSNIKINKSLRADDFTFKTDKETVYVNR